MVQVFQFDMTLLELDELTEKRDFASCYAAYEFLRPDALVQLRKLQQTKNIAMLLCLLENERNNAKLEKKEIEIISSYQKDEYGDTVAFNEFPNDFPFLLQRMLIETNKMIDRKSTLSNSLFDLTESPSQAVQVVKEILELSELIDENFEIKLTFLKTGYLPESLLNPLQYLSDDLAELQLQLQKLQELISKTKAKLKNPNELIKTGKAREWRDNLRIAEDKKAALMDKIKMLKT